MANRKPSVRLSATAAIFAAILFSANTLAAAQTAAKAQQETVLRSFGRFKFYYGGSNLYGGVILDKSGNLYGTTIDGGTHNSGIVFELTPNPDGSWTELVLHSFNPGAGDGSLPSGNLVFDAAGNLYGTSYYGGPDEAGTVFELTPRDGAWEKKVIHTFTDVGGGQNPTAGLAVDAEGNLYGTTERGGNGPRCGSGGCGTVFALVPQSDGTWTESVLHSFSDSGDEDGVDPLAGLIFDSSGNLYGTTQGGGKYEGGTVFELMPLAGGWEESVLYSLGSGLDGWDAQAGVISDKAGNLYGTTYYGGASGGGMSGCGTAFRLTPTSSGWTETLLYSFPCGGSDGSHPAFGAVTVDAAGNVFGTTSAGGVHNNGTVFELTPGADGSWAESSLFTFTFTDGSDPLFGLVSDDFGNLYGTTFYGGASGEGTVFEIKR